MANTTMPMPDDSMASTIAKRIRAMPTTASLGERIQFAGIARKHTEPGCRLVEIRLKAISQARTYRDPLAS